jgi:hypothetical protein
MSKKNMDKPNRSLDEIKAILSQYESTVEYEALYYLTQLETAAKLMFDDMVALKLPVPEEACRIFGKGKQQKAEMDDQQRIKAFRDAGYFKTLSDEQVARLLYAKGEDVDRIAEEIGRENDIHARNN